MLNFRAKDLSSAVDFGGVQVGRTPRFPVGDARWILVRTGLGVRCHYHMCTRSVGDRYSASPGRTLKALYQTSRLRTVEAR